MTRRTQKKSLTLPETARTLLKSPEPRAQSPEPRAQSPEPRAQSPEPRAQSPEPRAQSPEPRALAIFLVAFAALLGSPPAARAQTDTTPPVLDSATVLAADAGATIELVFDEAFSLFSAAFLPPTAFSVTADGDSVTIGSFVGVQEDNTYKRLQLRGLSPAIEYGQTVVVSYSDPTTGDDTAAIEDSAGNDVASFTTGSGSVPAVTNNVPPGVVPLESVDRAALVALYNATDGANWANNTSWLSDDALRDWYGVSTDSDDRVLTLSLYTNQLTGTIPPELGDLSELDTLYLDGNALTGSIPAELGQLSSLKLLFLDNNDLTGSIPTQLGQLSELTTLKLSQNQLTGSIPTQLGQLTKLVNLDLDNNALTGSIPTQLGQLSELQDLLLYRNALTGTIPTQLGQLTNLVRLMLYTNQLTGSIPTELGQLSQLEWLHLSGNQLTGSIPAELGQLSKLKFAYLTFNQLTGSIPAELGMLSKLEKLYLNDNDLTGTIQGALAQLAAAELDEISFWGNQLTGLVPTALGPAVDRAALLYFYLYSGSTRWTTRTSWLSDDPLDDWHGVSVDSGGRVTHLSVSSNGLTGRVHESLTVLEKLEGLYLQGNSGLTGLLPEGLRHLPNLEVVNVQDTELCPPPSDSFQNWLEGIEYYGSPCSPGRPTTIGSGSGDGWATMQWRPPEDEGGTPITHYEYRRTFPAPSSSDWTRIEPSDVVNLVDSANSPLLEEPPLKQSPLKSYKVTGLNNGQTYIYRLRAVSGLGPGPSEVLNLFPEAGAPLRPSNLRVEQYNPLSLKVSWNEPQARSGITITGYDLVPRGGEGGGGTSQFPPGMSEFITYTGPDPVTRCYLIRTFFLTAPASDGTRRNGISPYSVEACGSKQGEPEGGTEWRGHLRVFAAKAVEGEDATLDFDVYLDRPVNGPVTVRYRTRDLTARAGEDYSYTTGRLEFDPGQIKKTVSVPIIDDAIEDPYETLTLEIYNANGAGGIAVAFAMGRIYNSEDGTVAALAVADASGEESETLEFVVTLEPAATGTVTLDYATADGTATAGFDYTATSGTLTFAAGDTQKTIQVPTIVDAVDDDGETFTLTLSGASGARLADGHAIGSIRDTAGSSEVPQSVPLTASFKNLPESHDGESAFSLQVEFSEEIGISYASLRDEAFSVTRGDVTRARRVDGRHDLWEITVEPDSDEAVTITLPGNRDCGTAGAVCTRGGAPRPLSNSPSATVEGPPDEPLTASFSGMPVSHDGESAFTFGLTFSEEPKVSYRTLRDEAFEVTGSAVRKAQRKQQGSNQGWNITVEADGGGTVTIRLPETTDCNATGAICTADGRPLSNSLSATVAGPTTTLNFAHFANGDGITSEVVLVNVAPQPVRPTLYFYDQQGEPIAVESLLDIGSDLEIQNDGGLTIWTETEPLGELTISTHGRGDVVSGSVKVVCDGPIGGVLRFDLPGIGETVVGASPPVSDALFPVRRQEGGINTAVAIHNLEEEPMEVVCELMREGVLRDAVSLPLAANGQTSWTIDEAFPAADTSDFVGSVRCTAPGEGQFTGVAVELDADDRIVTTLPMVPVSPDLKTTLNFAHFSNGAGIRSEVVLVNVAPQPVRPTLYFYDQQGEPIAVESLLDIGSDLEIQNDGGLTVLTEMEPLGELTISTHGRGDLVSGSVKVVSDGPIGGVLRFDLPGIGETVVGASPPVSDALFPVRRQEGGINTGVAIHNLESSPGLVHCDLLREGVLLDAVSIPLEANGQTSWLIDQAFPNTDTSDFMGSVRCDAVGEELFSAVALEMDPGARIFTTLPVVPLEGR